MPELEQDVNQSGQSLPPVALPSSQESDIPNIATQDGQGGVINADQEDDRGYKNKYVEADRKLAVLEGKLQMMEGVVSKFQTPGQSQPSSTLQQKSQVEATQTQRDAELLRITEADLQEMEQTPEGRLQTANIRAERLSAYRREVEKKEAATESKVYDRVKREQNIETVLSQCKELNDPNSYHSRAYDIEFNRLGGSADSVLDAFTLAKARNPELFNGNALTETPQTRRDSLSQHSVGTVAPTASAPSQPPVEKLLSAQDIALAQALGNDVQAVANRVYKLNQQGGK